MALRNAFGDLGLDSTLQAIRDRLPVALGGTGGVKVDVGSSALPTGAATSTKQSDGSQKSQVVDGSGNVVGTTANALDVNIKSGSATTVTANAGTNLNTSALALDATLTGGSQQVQGNVASGSADSGNPVKVGGRYNSTKPTLTDGQRGDIQLGTRGSIPTTLYVADSTTAINVSPDNADGVAASATSSRLTSVSRGTVFNGTTWDRMYGTTSGTYNLIRDAAGNARGANVTATNALVVDGSAVTQPTSEKPSSSGGATVLYTGSIGNTATAVKASAGQMYSYLFTNNNSSISYVQFFNLGTGSVTVGTTAPLFSFGMPANTAANVSFPGGIAFSTAISVACTTTRAGSTSPTNTVDLNVFGV